MEWYGLLDAVGYDDEATFDEHQELGTRWPIPQPSLIMPPKRPYRRSTETSRCPLVAPHSHQSYQIKSPPLHTSP